MNQEILKLKTNTYSNTEESFWKGVKDCVPTLLGYLSIGFAAGVVEKTAGLSIMEIALLSIFVYAGSAQFIAAGMIAMGSPVSAIIFTILFVNLRHFLLSAALSPYFRHLSPWKNMYVGSLLTDETFGVAINQLSNKKFGSYKWMVGLNLTAYLNWIVANIAGGFFGNWIPNPEKFGLDFALPAMFIGLLVLQILSQKKYFVDIMVILSAVIIVVAVSFIFSGSVGVIVATILGATIGMVIEKWK
ncbi:branched-chain amino acid transporter AzlC [Heyndrickxia sporothermodurans]|uniref:AzlC family ABC transporter permease n=1 Tax=Heyndrickxia sporothermodurans TaxID=46224 RepID=A0AB37HEA3_9BACI|nr:AzlC family ABC transporter permease [Heyndrickxia sporothermodurans]MBL5782797.1 AzlC family ABC transporter permease [Heyndrickxia sporothermodurans]MBL5793340.1 AzlC family ABC transporter permease [Heyndrickxia sporothermodurans]MBL5797156.1 AzlC family ABC transporter permease [Heyndrickxia sporothermodurans]MBL5804487.1 AzlC family ABC transporter permease [Heyndrickxia sporothermodurans]MBL5808144.1 AzlC family ABC transporter permease [Heyndrickxia sporothermodurans]